MNKILICGATSFVAQGITIKLQDNEFEVECFSRGDEGREGKVVRGSYLSINCNQQLANHYDVIINYAVIKDGTVESNLQYIKSLIELCKDKGVKKLIHFSSVMVYSHNAGLVNENTPMESSSGTWMKGYGMIKIAVDEYLLSIKAKAPYEIVLVRPGYVLADNRPCPFIKPLSMRFAIIKGDNKSKNPIVKREEIHEAILKIIETKSNLPVYHFFPNDGMTKYRFAKQMGYKHLIPMPRLIFKYLPWLLMKVGIMSKAMYSRFDGMYNECEFSSELTEKKLNIKFT